MEIKPDLCVGSVCAFVKHLQSLLFLNEIQYTMKLKLHLFRSVVHLLYCRSTTNPQQSYKNPKQIEHVEFELKPPHRHLLARQLMVMFLNMSLVEKVFHDEQIPRY